MITRSDIFKPKICKYYFKAKINKTLHFYSVLIELLIIYFIMLLYLIIYLFISFFFFLLFHLGRSIDQSTLIKKN